MGKGLVLLGAAGVAGLGIGVTLRSLRGGACCSKRDAFTRAATAGAVQGGIVLDPHKYPKVRRDESVVEVLHGVSVQDPYRWLEDPDSEETKAFVEAQNVVTNEILEACDSRSQLKELLTKAYDYPKFGTPWKEGGRYFYHHNSGLQQHYVLYTQKGLEEAPTVVLDPNTLSSDGTVALTNTAFTPDGVLMAYSTSSGGSDWNTIQVLRLEEDGSVVNLPDELKFVKFSSLAWTYDGLGFFYNRYPEPKAADDLGTETDSNLNAELRYHVLGTPQDADPLVMTTPDHPTRRVSAEVTEDGHYLLLTTTEGCLPANMLAYVDLAALPRPSPAAALDLSPYDFRSGTAPLPAVTLVGDFSASFSVVANDGPVLYVLTNLNAPRFRIVKVDLRNPGEPQTWEEVVAEHPKDVLKSATALQGDFLVLKYLADVKSVLQLHRLTTGELLQPFPLPGVGTITSVSGSRHSSELFFSFQSFMEPGATYHVPDVTGDLTPKLLRRAQLSVPHNPDEYETKQVFVTSKDGTRVPMFIVHRKGLALGPDPPQPTLLYGYGGFNISLEPSFSVTRLGFIQGYNGVLAVANLRGGGEYGMDWRNAGSCENKQNVFDDFQACAEWLVEEGYSSPGKLIIQGGSNGGLLVAACVNQRPDLYGCALAQVGVLDMLRFHKFTIGHAWMTDYGNPGKAEDFAVVHRYSPLHNVRQPVGGSRQYPAMMLLTGDHDDRVVPLHSFKLAAELQHVLASAPESPQRNPLLIRVDVRAGHGAGKPTDKVLQEAADMFAFAAQCTSSPWLLPRSS